MADTDRFAGPLPPARDRGAWAQPDVHADTLEHLRAHAERIRADPWPVPLAHLCARYFREAFLGGAR
jgi:hypothetical protein